MLVLDTNVIYHIYSLMNLFGLPFPMRLLLALVRC